MVFLRFWNRVFDYRKHQNGIPALLVVEWSISDGALDVCFACFNCSILPILNETAEGSGWTT